MFFEHVDDCQAVLVYPCCVEEHFELWQEVQHEAVEERPHFHVVPPRPRKHLEQVNQFVLVSDEVSSPLHQQVLRIGLLRVDQRVVEVKHEHQFLLLHEFLHFLLNIEFSLVHSDKEPFAPAKKSVFPVGGPRFIPTINFVLSQDLVAGEAYLLAEFIMRTAGLLLSFLLRAEGILTLIL